MKTEFEEYFGGILSGKIVACDKMKKVAKLLMDEFKHPKEYHFDYDLAKKHTDFIETFCKQPSGNIGKPLELQLFQKARLQALFGFVDDDNIRQFNECLIIEARKNGKALALDTDIPTPNGFVKMGDIQVGDQVFGEDGLPHEVTFVSEVFKDHDCYKVTFRGGASVICDADHLWFVKNKHNIISARRTCDILHYKRRRKDGKGTEYLYRVPVTAAVEYAKTDLPIDPYSLGAWLGDGSCGDARITVSDGDIEETRQNLELFGHTTKIYHNKDRACSIGIDIVKKGSENKFLSALRELNVLNNKHIPEIYLHSSVNQRLELLRGLMDTDGYCEKSGQCEFCQKNEAFVDQVRELLSSLGIVSSKRFKTITCNGKVCHAYSVLFYTSKSFSCFRLKRKHARLKENLHFRMDWNSIIEIEKVDSVDCKCISVDSPRHLYLATRNYIVTHNTTETAAVEIDMLVNDGEGSPQIYNIATMLDQAKLGFNAALKMVRQSEHLSKHIKKRAADLYFPHNFGFIKALASNSNSLDGLDTHCGVIDELAAIKNRDLYDLVKQSMGARIQPILFCITTNGFVRENIFDSQYDYARSILEGAKLERFLPFIYELDDPTEWDQEDCWEKANPGIDTIKSRDYLRQMVQKAKDDPSFFPTVMVKDFNVKQTSETAWLRYEDLNNEELIDQTFDYCIGGFDAADSVDLNAAVALMQRPGDDRIYVKSMFWIPEEVIRQQNLTGNRRGRDSVPYELWIQQGYMRTCPGNKCDKNIFLDWFVELRDQYDMYTLFIGYDPWKISDDLLRAFRGEFGQNSMIPIRQGAKTCSDPLKSLAADFKAHRIVYDNNPVMKWNLINAEVKADINNNIQLVHAADRRKRNDGACALMDAYIVLKDNIDRYINLNGC